MADEQTPPPNNVAQLSAAREHKLSKSKVKRLFNASLARVHQETSGDKRELAEMAELRHKFANACSVLEALVRRHGSQVFDRAELETTCKFGAIMWEVTDTRVTLKLKPNAS